MSTQEKGVTVVSALKTSGMHYPDGGKVQVVDGHLYVSRVNGTTVAIYAPNQWVSAEIHE